MSESETTDQQPQQAAPPPAQAQTAPEIVPRPKTPEYVTTGFLYKFVLVTTVLSSLLAVFVYDRVFATKIVVFDLQQYLTKIRQDAVENKLTPEEYKNRLDRLESAVKSVPKNTLIVTGDVILGENAKQLNVPGFKPEKPAQGGQQ